MNKVIMSIVFVLVVAVGGYFVDPGYASKINGLIGKAPVATKTVASESVPTIQSKPFASNVLSSGVLVASVQNPSKPFYSEPSGRPIGFNVDFLTLLADQPQLGAKVKRFEYVPTDTYANVPKQLLQNNQINFAIDGLTFNDEDLPGVVYTIPYVKDFGYSLITLKGVNVNSASDLTGLKVGVLQGDPDVKAFVEGAFPGVKIVELSDKADANGKWIVGHIKSGKVDAVVYDYPFAVAEVEGTELQFAMSKIKGSDIQYRIGVRKTDTELLALLNGAIKSAIETPQYSELLKKYFMSTNVAAVRRASSGEASYIVVRGDTLGIIAKSQLGDTKRYTDIQTRNNLANPNFISVGQKLIVPTK